MKSQTSDFLKSLSELSLMFQNLFEKARANKVKLHLMNQPHDRPYVGEPIWCPLKPTEPIGIAFEGERLVIKNDNVIYRIRQHGTKNPLVIIKLLLKWATESFQNLVNGILPDKKILEVPHSMVFFSASTLPRRKPVPIW